MEEYRPITPDDRREVKRLAARAFGPLGGVMVSLEKGGHVVVEDGRIIGASILKTFSAGGKRVGTVSWIMAHPKTRGRGIATRLLDLAHEWFEERGVDCLASIVEGYNQSSSKLFQTRGYRPLTLFQQIATFGWGVFRLWFSSFLVFSVAHFLWFREADSPPQEGGALADVRPLAQWLGAVVVNAVLIAVIMLRWGVPVSLPVGLAVATGIASGLLAVRTLLFAIVMRLQGVRVTFRGWSGGLVLALGIAALTGGFLPMPGSVYPRERSYRYAERARSIGWSSLIVSLVLSGALVGLRLVGGTSGAGEVASMLFAVLRTVLPIQIAIELLFPSFPLWGYLGRQLWVWSRPMWIVAALAAAGALLSGLWL